MESHSTPAAPAPASVSVIVTTYESPAYLAQVMNAYLDQTRRPDEMIVADDGSGEPTRRVIAEFAARAPFAVKHVRQEHDGFRAARVRNLGIDAATGDYLLFTDGDCIPEVDLVGDHLRIAAPKTMVIGRRLNVHRRLADRFTGREGRARYAWRRLTGGLFSPPSQHGKVHSRAMKSWPWVAMIGVFACNMGIHRADALAVNGFNEEYVGWGGEDLDFAIRLMRFGCVRRDTWPGGRVFHLWHEPVSRSNLERNRLLRDAALSGPIFAPNGLRKPTPSPAPAVAS
jgi:glycosyltransferase involved in cell wall biosynthesis